ncbi:MAG: hypothetical protein IT161_06685 [Bryobacterales bacterium]|nr:hypothetical protein [Bryobacterales bacterium]
MRNFFPLLIALPLLAAGAGTAKDEPQAPVAGKAEEQKPEEKKAEEKVEAAPAESPAPQLEGPLSGYIDAGFRIRPGLGGDRNTYRSIVNLGEGIRLMGMDVNYLSPANKALDEFHLQGYNWGGDPYNTARLDAGKRGAWHYLGTYSNVAYFNYLPSFANPGSGPAIPGGPKLPLFMNERAYDTALRNFDNLLELFPGKHIIPFAGYQRNEMYGNGITTLVAGQNEYPLRNVINWRQNMVRGGARFEFSRFHATVEGGHTSYTDGQEVYSTEKLNGNRTVPYLGQTLFLTNGKQTYDVTGSGPYAKVLATAQATRWIDLYGQFLYTQPSSTVKFQETAAGNLVDPMAPFLFYAQTGDVLTGSSKLPHSSGLVGAEVRLGERLRVRETWDTDRFHTSSAALLATTLTPAAGAVVNRNTSYNDLTVVNHDRNQLEALFDVTSKIMFRGGWRWERGNASSRANTYNPAMTYEPSRMERNVGLAGLQVRPFSGLTWNLDYERGDGKQTYYRTGLMTYYKFRTQVRYQFLNDFHINALYSVFNNENPSAGSGYKYQAQQGSLSLQWMPQKFKALTLLSDYTWSSIHSDITYLIPSTMEPVASLYRDNAHALTALADLTLAPKFGLSPRLSLGGSLVRTSGSRPTQYYQPVGKVIVPVHRKAQFYSEWRWYGLSQPFYLYEGFRDHQIVVGLRFIL